MYIYIYTYIYTHIYIYIHIYIYTHTISSNLEMFYAYHFQTAKVLGCNAQTYGSNMGETCWTWGPIHFLKVDPPFIFRNNTPIHYCWLITHIHIYTHVQNVYISIDLCIYVSIYLHICICTWIYIIGIYVYIYTYKYTFHISPWIATDPHCWLVPYRHFVHETHPWAVMKLSAAGRRGHGASRRDGLRPGLGEVK